MKNEKKSTTTGGKKKEPVKNKKGGSALLATSIGRSATAQVHHHTDAGFGRTGTNVSYEGPTAPGAGGSMGTGYASGQPATGTTIHTNSDYEQNRGGSPAKNKVNAPDEDEFGDDVEGDYIEFEEFSDKDE